MKVSADVIRAMQLPACFDLVVNDLFPKTIARSCIVPSGRATRLPGVILRQPLKQMGKSNSLSGHEGVGVESRRDLARLYLVSAFLSCLMP
jgi:hypothetical protein